LSFKVLILFFSFFFASCGVKSPPRAIQDDSISNYISNYTDREQDQVQKKTEAKKK